MPVIPQDYLAVVALIATFISHKIRTDQLSDNANSLIAGTAVIILVGISVWMTTGFTSDVKADVLLVCSMAFAIAPAIKELLDLLGYQYQASSPLAGSKQEDDPPV